MNDLILSDVCEADEIYVTAGEKDVEKEIIRRSDGRVEFLIRENLQDVDDEISDRGDETVILWTDDYTIYDEINEYDGIASHLAITHDDTYVLGDAHVNSCENRHSILHRWL